MNLTWIEVDLNAISYNINQIKSLVESKGSKLLAVVKDDAYGHGAIEIANLADKIPVYKLGVATVDEAIELREAGISLPILVLGTTLPDHAEEIIKNNITQTVCDLNICKELAEAARKLHKKAKVHVKVDTGMGRIGVHYKSAADYVKTIRQFPELEIEGIFTHFAVADTEEIYTNLQIERFQSTISMIEKNNIHIPIKHSANSSAILNFPESYFNMVRPGIAIYGIYPCHNSKIKLCLKPALSLKTKVVYLKEVAQGESLSYGRTYITQRTTKVATIAIGYGHGLNRKLSNNGEVIIRGKKAPIIGTICMDQSLCDVTHIRDVSVGDEVIVIGKQGEGEIRVDDLAEKVGTISYEVLCNISKRVPRLYLYNDSERK